MHLLSFLQDAAIHLISPRRWLQRRLAGLNVEASGFDPAAIDRKLPWCEIEALARRINPAPTYVQARPFSELGSIVDLDWTDLMREWLDVRDIYGVSASGSHIFPLADLSRTSIVDDIVTKADIQKAVTEVLHGTSDCVARKDTPVEVLRQAWDGRLYVRNNGGSHRAAIWRWHRERQKLLMMDCAVATARLSEGTLNAVRRYRFWLMTLRNALEVPPCVREVAAGIGFGNPGGADGRKWLDTDRPTSDGWWRDCCRRRVHRWTWSHAR